MIIDKTQVVCTFYNMTIWMLNYYEEESVTDLRSFRRNTYLDNKECINWLVCDDDQRMYAFVDYISVMK